MEADDVKCQERSWVERCNIKFAEYPVGNGTDFVKVFSKQIDGKRSNAIQDVFDKIEVNVPDISSLSENKQLLLGAIASVKSAILVIKSICVQTIEKDAVQRDTVTSIDRFLTKLYLLLSSLLQTHYISNSVYKDLFSTFLDSCEILSWPAETIHRTLVISGEEHKSFPDLFLLSKYVNDTSMKTLGTVTYSDENFDIQRLMQDDKHVSYQSSQNFNKEPMAGTSTQSDFPTTSCQFLKTNDSPFPSSVISTKKNTDIVYSTSPQQNQKPNASNWSLLLKDLIGQSINQENIGGTGSKRTVEGRIKQPAVKLPAKNVTINKIPIIITLAADDEETTPASIHVPTPGRIGLGHPQSFFEPPGRKLKLPSKLFSGIRSAIELEFPSTRLLLEQHNSRRPIIPIVVATTEADMETTSREDPTSRGEKNDTNEDISNEKRRRIDPCCSNNSCESQYHSAFESQGSIYSSTPVSNDSRESIAEDKDKVHNSNRKDSFENSDSDLDFHGNENFGNNIGNNRNASSKISNSMESLQSNSTTCETSESQQCQSLSKLINTVRTLLDVDINFSNKPEPMKNNNHRSRSKNGTSIPEDQGSTIQNPKEKCKSDKNVKFQFQISGNVVPTLVYYRRNPNMSKHCGNKEKMTQKCPQKKHEIEIGSNQLTFKRKLEDIPHSSNRYSQNVGEDVKHSEPDKSNPSIFTVSPQNSMYSFRINSAFEGKSVESPNPCSSNTEFVVHEIQDTSKRQFIELSSIDWLLGQPLAEQDAFDLCSNPLLSETSWPDSGINYISSLTSTAANQEKATFNQPQKNTDVGGFAPPESPLSVNWNINALTPTQSRDNVNGNVGEISITVPSAFIRILLTEWPHSLIKPISVGFFLHKTKVVVAALEISQAHFNSLSANKTLCSDNCALIRYTKELDLLKKPDRATLAYIASQLSSAVK